MDEEEVEAAVRVLKSRSLCRYYGVDLTNWGLHVYFNIPSLVNKTSVDKKGWPWKLSENRSSNSNYHKGSCPVADRLFERSILLAIPSCLTERDEGDIVHAFRKVLGRPA